MSVINDVNKWASEAKTYAVWMLFFLSASLTIAGLVFFVFDVQTSYLGWGKYAHTVIDAGESGMLLSLAVSLLPTLIQAAWYVSKVTGLSFVSNHAIFSVMSVVAFIFDTALDTFKLYKPDGGLLSFIGAVITAILVFGVLSEILVSFFMPIALTLGKNLMSNVNLSFDDMFEPSQQQNKQQQRQQQQQRK